MSNLVTIGFLATLVLSQISFGQDFQAYPMSMAGQTGLISFRYEIGDKTAKLFVVGTEAARLNFEKDVKLLELTAFQDKSNTEQLQFEPDRGYYVVKNPPKWGLPYEVRVRAKVGDQEKVIKLQIKP